MKVGLLTYSTRPRGGVVHTLALAEALARRADVEVAVVSLARGGDEGFFRPVDPAVDVRLIPFPDVAEEEVGPRILRSIDVMAEALSGLAVDVVHAQDCISANAALRTGVEVVRTVHHLDRFTTPELAACHERALVGPAHHVCVSDAVAREVEEGWGLVPEVIPNGVESARFARAAGPDGAEGRAMWARRIGAPYVLNVGGIEPRKGTVDLVEAVARLGRDDLALVIAGGETLFDYRDYRAAFDRRCVELGVAPILLGPVDHGELPALVAQAAAFAFPSTKEGFGLAAMEALAAGVPLVCRDLPVLREVFDGTARFGEDPDGLAVALKAALTQRDLPDGLRRRRAGQHLAATYSWDTAAASHLAAYRRWTV